LYLKSLTIRGFKSFAEKTHLKFEPGITIIVGPNGSGKSNITDAVLWVLGEQSARSLRGSAMEDVIFAGSPARAGAGLAEVSLFLDNSDGILPIEFSEVSVTRRMSRTGESEYFINNSPCRLLDIQEMLMDSGLGREMYSIVSQGKLEEILSSRPEDRRLLIEEAAGVLKYKRRKERALRKLVSMDQNLVRAKDILREVNRQVQPLEKQARRAENYNNLSEKLKYLEVSSSVRELGGLQDEWDELAAVESNLKEKMKEFRNRIAVQEKERESIRVKIEENQANTLVLAEHKRRLHTCVDRISNGLFLLDNKRQNLRSREQELKYKIRQIEERLEKRGHENAGLDEKRKGIAKQKDEIGRIVDGLQKELDKEEKEHTQLIEKIDDLENRISQVLDTLEDDEEKLRVVRSSIHNHKLKIEFLETQGKACQQRIENYRKAIAQSKQDYRDQEKLVADLSKEKKKLTEKLERLTRDNNELKSRHEKIRNKIAVLTAEQKAFENLRTALNESSSLEIIKEAEVATVLGVLGELISVSKGYEKAIEAVLGTDLMCLLAESIEDAEQIATFALKEKVKSLNMLAGKRAKRKIDKAVLNQKFIPAFDVIDCEKKIKDRIASLFDDVYIVPDIGSAFEFLKSEKSEGHYTLVTEAGEVIQSSGKIYIGSGAESLKLLHRGSLEELSKKIKEQTSRLRLLEKEIMYKSEEESALSQEQSVLSRNLREKEIGLRNLAADQERAEGEIRQTELQKEEGKQELGNLAKSIDIEVEKEKELTKKITADNEELNSIKQELSKLIRSKQDLIEKRNEINQEIIKRELELSASEEQDNYLQKQSGLISEDESELKTLLDSENNLQDSLKTFGQRFDALKNLWVDMSTLSDSLIEEIGITIASEEAASNELKRTLGSEKEENAALSEKIGELQEKIQSANITRAQLEMQVKSISQKITDEYNIPMDRAIKEYRCDSSPDDLKMQAKQVKETMENLGPVNPVAVEEFNELKERQQFLANQIDDLTESRKALEKIAGAIDRKIKARFLKAFQEVNYNFQSVFSYLFEGGEAEIILDDLDDPLNSGISFNVHPAGKRLQRVTLLSGGEAALVALAFLFAIHHTRPSPFYILDEVEPALDSMNLQRFTAFLRAQSKETQFLIITHQKRTMEIADLLYGVSMTPEGVSSVISQKLVEFENAENGNVYAT